MTTPTDTSGAPTTATSTGGSSGPRHVQELEGLRAVAAGAVLLTHAGFMSGAIGRDVLPGLLARMDIGVAVFFVLSGFLLYRPHARANAGLGRTPEIRTFFARRAARLVPAWLVVLAVTPLLVPAARAASPGHWVANLLQLQSLKQSWLLPGLAQLWSLSAEVMFYLALPGLAAVVVWVCRGRGPRAEVAAIAALALAAQVFRWGAEHVLPTGYTWLQTLPATLDWFAAGMLLAVLTSAPGRWTPLTTAVRRSPTSLWVIAAAVLWVLTTRLAGPYDLRPPTTGEQTFKHLGYGIVAFLVVAPSAVGATTPLSPVLASRLMGYLGKISYGVFLWHLPVMFAVRNVLGYPLFNGHFWTTLVLTLLPTIALSAVSWHVLESPVQAWVRDRTPSRPQRA
ncbi:acyltransferase [Phycicoccus sp. Root101]|uniref:acyltransferase family protein n=1 Tax=Phycicoccus sp. Root101 TaxID=1736421 RepID=UPI0007032BF0|nr:acyltransferase [Phycicoccus sp. Root101]KQU68538.1 hypothetical protein ASC58_07380 [Phycicoccus sp. Root101]